MLYTRGEILCQEGATIEVVRVLQSGLVSVLDPREKKSVEITHLKAPHLLGEEVLNGKTRFEYRVVAVNDTQVLEIPTEAVKKMAGALPELPKLILRGLLEKCRHLLSETHDYRLESDVAPCPPSGVAKVFGVIFHVARYTGTLIDGKITVSYPAFRRYAQRIFLESPIRLEQALFLLVKLGYAEVQLVKNEVGPEEPDEIGFLFFSNLERVEAFFDFYQNVFFRGASSNVLRVDDRIVRLVQVLLDSTQDAKTDRMGVTWAPYVETMDRIKVAMGNTFTPDQIYRVEQKGLFLKRVSGDDGGFLTFYRSEYLQALENWKFLKEIEKWNAHGSIDFTGLPEEKVHKPNLKRFHLSGPKQPHSLPLGSVDEGGHDPGSSDEAVTQSSLSPAVVSTKKGNPKLEGGSTKSKRSRPGADWTPEVLRRKGDQEYIKKFPVLRSGAPKPGEVLCGICLSVVDKTQAKCSVCDAPLKKAG